MTIPDWARAHGGPLCVASIRSEAADFRVDEALGFPLTGQGEHDFLHVEKTGANTEWVARQLARHAGVAVRDVGYAGLKDRHAVTRQWFSVPRRDGCDWQRLAVDGVRLLEQGRHGRKLRRGAHSANHFRIVLRGDLAPVPMFEKRLRTLRDKGVPNYFGAQRFGRGGANLRLADEWASGRRLPRHKRSIAMSAARSYLFNQQLDDRVRDGSWDRVMPGDVVNLDGSASVFRVDDVDAQLEQRCRDMDIHPAGVLWGEGAPGDAAMPDSWRDALLAARVAARYRSLRLPIGDLALRSGDDTVTLEFRLGRGAFATAVLREIVEIEDLGLSSPKSPGS